MNTQNETRLCYRCGLQKQLDAFILRVDDRHYNTCRQCVSEVLSFSGPRRRSRLKHTETHRTCYLCNRLLPRDRFTKRSNGTYFSAWKDCNSHVFAQRRRARLLGADGDHTVAEWEALVALHDHCPRCGRGWQDIPPRPADGVVITEDHIIPISGGGSNRIDNIRPLCYSCNSKKGAKLA